MIVTTKVHAPPRDVVLGIQTAENTGDWNSYRQLLAEDVIIEHPGIGAIIGIEENYELVRGFVERVENYRRDVFDLVADDDTAAFRFSITGVYGDPPDELDVAGAVFCRVREGRLVRVVELVTRTNVGGGSDKG